MATLKSLLASMLMFPLLLSCQATDDQSTDAQSSSEQEPEARDFVLWILEDESLVFHGEAIPLDGIPNALKKHDVSEEQSITISAHPNTRHIRVVDVMNQMGEAGHPNIIVRVSDVE